MILRFTFYAITFLVGGFCQIIFSRYLTFWGASPDLLMLAVLAFGFIFGSVVGQWLGFSWGLWMDTIGVHLFGLNGFLFALMGYLAGKLRRRIDSERPIPQLVIALMGTLFYCVGFYVIQSVLNEPTNRLSWTFYLLKTFFNGVLSLAVFWGVVFWTSLWQMQQERH